MKFIMDHLASTNNPADANLLSTFSSFANATLFPPKLSDSVSNTSSKQVKQESNASNNNNHSSSRTIPAVKHQQASSSATVNQQSLQRFSPHDQQHPQSSQFFPPNPNNTPANILADWQSAYSKYPLPFLQPPQQQQQQLNNNPQPSPVPTPPKTSNSKSSVSSQKQVKQSVQPTQQQVQQQQQPAIDLAAYAALLMNHNPNAAFEYDYLQRMNLLLPPAPTGVQSNQASQAPAANTQSNSQMRAQSVKNSPNVIQNTMPPAVSSPSQPTTPKFSSSGLKQGKKQLAKEYEQQQLMKQQNMYQQQYQQQQVAQQQNPYLSMMNDPRFMQSSSFMQQSGAEASSRDYMNQMMMAAQFNPYTQHQASGYNTNSQYDQFGTNGQSVASQVNVAAPTNSIMSNDMGPLPLLDVQNYYSGYTEFQEPHRIIWSGSFSIKSELATVALNYVSGSMDVARMCLHQISEDCRAGPMRILSRMRLEPNQLEGVQQRLLVI